jgi:transposase
MEESITWVGIDAHKKTLVVAVLHPGNKEPEQVEVENDERSISKLVRRQMLVRRGYVFRSTSRLWSEAHRRWLASVVFDDPTDRVVFAEYMLAIEQAERRLGAIDSELDKAAQLPLYREHVGWLRCFRGVDTTIAMIFVAELHGIERFESPRALAAYLGLVPTLYASGESAHRGKITKTGNGHIRRALVQACWGYRHRAAVGPKLRARRQGQPERVLTIADEAQRRLTTRYRRLIERRKTPNKVVIAIARELVGFFWAALREDRSTARHGARISALLEGANATAAPRSLRAGGVKKTSRTEVGQRHEARKEKRAI